MTALIQVDDEFKVGSFNFNPLPNFNFQLNRTVMWNGGDPADISRIAGRITDSGTWKKEMIALGDQALSQGRHKEAIAYYRMSEFFMFDGDPDKLKYYRLAAKMFSEYYHDYFERKLVIRYEVPYENVKLPVMYTGAQGEKKGIVLFHGGNDSYYEEFFIPMLYFSEHGFDVYLFEGPGQGSVLRLQGKPFTYRWEKPVKAIMDKFDLDDVTIVGASLGGMLAPRAAAFEKRIRRVVAWSIFPGFMDLLYAKLPPAACMGLGLLLKTRAKVIVDLLFNHAAKKNEMLKWGLGHGLYAYGASSPYQALSKLSRYQMLDIAPLIDQDVLIIGANQDHFIDYRLVGKEIDALTDVRSLTVRLFTEKEDAGAHCNVGNAKLVMDTMINWISSVT
ncbi:MAG: alpha/beta hydrolase [Spirochaetia bacterium]|jgi:alpha-beta hydrolase superfamily lysophospholipase|nr:alpha/beta hydrolase [Spirochaetia bacterium]